jgi:2-haloacid dehalogenase
MVGSPNRPVQNDLSSPTPLPKTPPKLMSGVYMAFSPPPRALFFDVFGTCVNWRATVVTELNAQAHAALNSATASLASRVRLTASDMTIDHWGKFAQQWRERYGNFTRTLATDSSVPWKSVDEHHLESLRKLVVEWEIDGLWNDEELRAISLVWHRLEPWEDSAMGVAMLNRLFCKFRISLSHRVLTSQIRVPCPMATSAFLQISVPTVLFLLLTYSLPSCSVPTNLRHVCTSELPISYNFHPSNALWLLLTSTI